MIDNWGGGGGGWSKEGALAGPVAGSFSASASMTLLAYILPAAHEIPAPKIQAFWGLRHYSFASMALLLT